MQLFELTEERATLLWMLEELTANEATQLILALKKKVGD